MKVKISMFFSVSILLLSGGLFATSSAVLAAAVQSGESVLETAPGASVFKRIERKDYRVSLHDKPDAIRQISTLQVTGWENPIQIGTNQPDLQAEIKKATETAARIENGAEIYETEKLVIRKAIVPADRPSVFSSTFEIELKDTNAKIGSVFLSLSSRGLENDDEAADRKLGGYIADKFEAETVSSEFEAKTFEAVPTWLAAESRYFVLAVANRGEANPKSYHRQAVGKAGGQGVYEYSFPGNRAKIDLEIAFSPKKTALLKTVFPGLENVVDYGVFSLFAKPILYLLSNIQKYIFSNYGLAIILLTIIIRILTFPLNYRGAKKMRELQNIQPEITAMREKFKGNPQMLALEQARIMRESGVNPVSGCLPILIQIPIFFTLWRVLYSSIELYQTPFFGWIHDLSSKDPFFVLPVILIGLMYIQQKLSPMTGVDPTQRKMMEWLPVVFGVFMMTVPSGLVVYSLVSTALGIVQQRFLNSKFPPVPGATTPSMPGF